MIVHITMDSKNFEGQYFNAAHVEAIDDKEIHYSKYISIRQIMIIIRKVFQRNGNMTIFEAFWSV